MRILALDVATKTGWAVLMDDERIESGMQDFTLKRGESKGMLFYYFRHWLRPILSSLRPDIVVYEAAHHRGGHATEVCVGLVTRIKELIDIRNARSPDHEIEYCAVHSATLKKHITGNGRASKNEVKVAVRQRLGRHITDDNEADALALMYYAEDTLKS